MFISNCSKITNLFLRWFERSQKALTVKETVFQPQDLLKSLQDSNNLRWLVHWFELQQQQPIQRLNWFVPHHFHLKRHHKVTKKVCRLKFNFSNSFGKHLREQIIWENRSRTKLFGISMESNIVVSVKRLFGPHFLCWISGVVPFNMWLISSWEENKCCYKLSKILKMTCISLKMIEVLKNAIYM